MCHYLCSTSPNPNPQLCSTTPPTKKKKFLISLKIIIVINSFIAKITIQSNNLKKAYTVSTGQSQSFRVYFGEVTNACVVKQCKVIKQQNSNTMHDMINSSWIDPSKYPTRVALFENFLQWAFDNQVMIKKAWKIVPSKQFVGSTSVL